MSMGLPPHGALVLSPQTHKPIYRVRDVLEAFTPLERPPGLHGAFPDPYSNVGDSGSLTGQIKAPAQELGIMDRVRFICTVAEDDLAPLLGRACAYVTASYPLDVASRARDVAEREADSTANMSRLASALNAAETS